MGWGYLLSSNFINLLLYVLIRLTSKLAENELDKIDKIKIRRNCIPSKDDPPEEMMEWLKTFSVSKIVVFKKLLTKYKITLYSNYFIILLYFILLFYRNGQMQKEC